MSPEPSRARRLLRLIDPAEPGFVRRVALLALAMLGLALCSLASVAVYWLLTPPGRYWTAVFWLGAEDNARAERTAEALVREYPDRSFQYYRLWATALRRAGKVDQQVQVFEEAVRAFPDDWEAQSNYCWYGALFADPRAVLPACDRAVELAPPGEDLPFTRRAVARALSGDREGAIADLETLIDYWDQIGYHGRRYQTRMGWLETLQAGGDPFDEETMDWLRTSF